jgi:hypothetical protein
VQTILASVTEIKEQIGDVQVQAMLLSFSNNAGVVKEFFATYTDSLSSLASSDPDTQKAGATDLFTLFSLNNAMKVAQAMTAIQQAFLPGLSEQEGLLQFQKIVVNNAMMSAGSSYDGFQPASQPAQSVPLTNAAGQIGAYSGAGLLAASQQAATHALDSVVLDTFRAFVTVSIQGLILLNGAWLGTIHAAQIRAQVQAIEAVLAAMADFADAVPALVDTQAGVNLQAYGKRVTISGKRWDHGGGNVSDQNPYGPDWIQWEPGLTDDGRLAPYIAQAPWTYMRRMKELELDNQGRINDGDEGAASHLILMICRYNPAAPSALRAFMLPLATHFARQAVRPGHVIALTLPGAGPLGRAVDGSVAVLPAGTDRTWEIEEAGGAGVRLKCLDAAAGAFCYLQAAGGHLALAPADTAGTAWRAMDGTDPASLRLQAADGTYLSGRPGAANLTSNQADPGALWAAAPVLTLDQAQINYRDGEMTGLGDDWQSFTAGVTGSMARLDLMASAIYAEGRGPLEGTLQLYEGEGTAGLLLCTEAIALQRARDPNLVMTFATPFDVVAGQKFTFRLIVRHGYPETGSAYFYLYRAPASTYPRGIYSRGHSALVFRTWVKAV